MNPIAKYKRDFYYEQLEVDGQQDYKALAAAVAGFQPTVKISSDDGKLIRKTILAVKYDNPEMFFWNTSDPIEIKNGTLSLKYFFDTEEETRQQVKRLREKRQNILKELIMGEDVSVKDIFEKIYGYLVKNVAYAYDELQEPGSAPWIYDIRGPLLKDRGVCLGIAQALAYICQPLRIPLFLITGDATIAGFKCNHAWNMVQFNDEWFHLDATCEIGDDASEEKRKYFLLKDKELTTYSHSWRAAGYPKAE